MDRYKCLKLTEDELKLLKFNNFSEEEKMFLDFADGFYDIAENGKLSDIINYCKEKTEEMDKKIAQLNVKQKIKERKEEEKALAAKTKIRKAEEKSETKKRQQEDEEKERIENEKMAAKKKRDERYKIW